MNPIVFNLFTFSEKFTKKIQLHVRAVDFNKGNVVIVSLKLLLYNDKKKTSANLWHWKICGILKLITLKRFEDNLKGVEHLFQKPRFHCKERKKEFKREVPSAFIATNVGKRQVVECIFSLFATKEDGPTLGSFMKTTGSCIGLWRILTNTTEKLLTFPFKVLTKKTFSGSLGQLLRRVSSLLILVVTHLSCLSSLFVRGKYKCKHSSNLASFHSDIFCKF
ncbi:hypothetical protein P5673_003748 [Acropora cervicornis]|uniref:Uncharacterized protein n=1 Tax=Acropora cervicornis TaxID=6130 RepID=A0AAD9R127_ACRCE|nr:hypothetical protein P5673_003748 [Acropora cervicornis]